MSILIKGMDLPKAVGVNVTIFPDGRVVEYRVDGERIVGNAVQPPEKHGRLIDADVVIQTLKRLINLPYNKRVSTSWSDAFDSFVDRLEEQDVIIEAEGGGQ